MRNLNPAAFGAISSQSQGVARRRSTELTGTRDRFVGYPTE
jgi:hypothetical protein